MKKKSSRKVLTIAIISIGLLGVVGAAAALTKGFTNFEIVDKIVKTDEEKSSEAVKENYRSFDFSNEQSGSLNETTLLNFVNNHNREKKEVFSQVSEVELPESETIGPCISNVYLDGALGIRLGTQNNIGFFGLDCVKSYKFDHVKIEAVNYHKWNEGSEQYDKEINGSKLSINGYEVDLKADASVQNQDIKITKTITFSDLQSSLYIIGTKGRPCILKAEFWSE